MRTPMREEMIPPAKALAIDLDGTLLSSRKGIAPETLLAIRALAAEGWLIIIATARPVRSVELLASTGIGDYYWATCNGAWILKSGSVLARTEIPFDETVKWMKRLTERGLRVQIEANDTLYGDVEVLPEFVGGCRPLREYRIHDACKILVTVTSKSEIREITEHLGSHLSMVVTDGGRLVQVARKDCGKLNAVRTILSMEGLGLQNLIAFGDDNNDIDLLEAAGFGVAMANATPGVLEAADHVTASNDEDGVGDVLRTILNGDPKGWPQEDNRG